MRLFIKGQEIATRSENLIEDQYVTDDILNSVPIVLVTGNTVPPEPEPEPDVVWLRQISNDLIADATLEYNVTRNSLTLHTITWNPIFENKYAARFYVSITPENVENVGNFATSAGNDQDPFRSFNETEYNNGFYISEINLFNAQQELNNVIDMNCYVDSQLDEETFNNMTFSTYYEISHNNRNDAEFDLLRMYYTIRNFFRTKQYKFFKTIKSSNSTEPQTFEGCLVKFERMNLIEMPGTIKLDMLVETEFTRNCWLVNISVPAETPFSFPDNFWCGAIDTMNPIDGVYDKVNGEIKSELIMTDNVTNNWALSSEDCPFYVDCEAIDEYSDRATIKAKKSITIQANRTLYISKLQRFFNAEYIDYNSGILYPQNKLYENSKTYNEGDTVAENGTLQIYCNDLDYETCNNLITEQASIQEVWYETTVTEVEV